MQDASVRKLFQEQINYYSKPDLGTESLIIPLAIQWIKSKKFQRKIEICEFGGGAGQLLNEIQKSYTNVNLTNVEIINDYKPFLFSKKIKFVKGSILDSQFSNNSFDILIMRDVMHHLVGNTFKEAINNQHFALQELKRLVKPGGAVFIEEFTNESSFATHIIYYLSKLNSVLGMNSSLFRINSNTIVAFLTSDKFLNLVYENFGKENIVKKKIVSIEKKWYFKLLHLGSELKKVTIVAKKPR